MRCLHSGAAAQQDRHALHCFARIVSTIAGFYEALLLCASFQTCSAIPTAPRALLEVRTVLLQVVVEPFLAEKELSKVLGFMRDMLVGMDSLHSGETPECCYRPACSRSGSLAVLLFVRGIVTSALLGRRSSQTADVQQVEPTGPRRPAACLQSSASPHMMPMRRCFPTLHVMACKPSQGCP